MKPVSARFPVSSIRRSGPTRSSISAHSAAVRWSFHRIGGPDHAVLGVEHDEPVHLAGETDARDLAARATPRRAPLDAARHQSSGSCSDQPGRGVESG